MNCASGRESRISATTKGRPFCRLGRECIKEGYSCVVCVLFALSLASISLRSYKHTHTRRRRCTKEKKRGGLLTGPGIKVSRRGLRWLRRGLDGGRHKTNSIRPRRRQSERAAGRNKKEKRGKRGKDSRAPREREREREANATGGRGIMVVVEALKIPPFCVCLSYPRSRAVIGESLDGWVLPGP